MSCVRWHQLPSPVKIHLLFALQMVLQTTVHLTAGGLGLAHALQLVVAGLTVELAAILRLRMAGRIV